VANIAPIDKIQNNYNSLSSAEKTVANYILKNPDEVVKCTIKELATASNVSEATVVRMCQHLGYKGYWSFRISLAAERNDSEAKVNRNEDGSFNTILLRYAKMIENLAGNIDENSMRICSELLLNCGYVHIIAGGNTGTLGAHLAFRLGRLGISCTQNNVPEYYVNNINSAKPEDVVFAISRSGITKDVLKGIEMAKERNLKVVAITAYKDSSIAEQADIVLESKGDFTRFDFYKDYSHVCEMAVIDALCELMQQYVNERPDKKELNMLEFILSDSKI